MRVLVVEDDPDLLRALSRALREAGYAVDEANDGASGLSKALSTEYECVVLDLMLPKVDGWEILRQLRQNKKTPVLVLSARDTVPDRVKGLDSGADDYLVKPFDLVELLSRLRALIRRAAGTATSEIEIGDVTINLRTRSVQHAGGRVALTAREYSLIEFLALHRGSLVTRTMIYDHLFDENDESLSNLVDVYIANIRRKLGKDIITTRRGQGYIIDV